MAQRRQRVHSGGSAFWRCLLELQLNFKMQLEGPRLIGQAAEHDDDGCPSARPHCFHWNAKRATINSGPISVSLVTPYVTASAK